MKYLVGILGLLFALSAYSNCQIEAKAVVGILDFEIEGCSIDGKLVESGGHISGTFTVDLTKLDTGIDLRNRHMKEKYLEVDKYPIATMRLEPIKIGANKFKGHLKLHGKELPVNGTVLKSSKDELRATFSIKITDFGIEKPGYKGVVIGETVNLFVVVP